MLKTIFTKFCFCLGLSTATVYSFHQVQAWVSGELPKKQNSFFKHKVRNLLEQPNLDNTVERIVYVPVDAKPVMLPEAPAAAPVKAEVVGNVSPSPSPAAVSEAFADSPANEVPKTDGDMTQNDGQNFGVPSYAQPIFQNLAQQEETLSAKREGVEANSQQNSFGQVGTGIALNQHSNGNGSNVNGSLHSSGVDSGNQISPQDLAILSTHFKGTIALGPESVSGSVCQGLTLTCQPVHSTSVNSTRWSVSEGLSSDVNFLIKGENAAKILFTMNMNIQDKTLAFQKLSASVTATSSTVRTENRAGKKYRVFDLRLSDMTIRAGDTLSALQATIVFDMTGPTPVLTNESGVSFVRSNVTTLSSAWDGTPNRGPAEEANQNKVIADQMTYSTSIEKSQ